jgi:hypothetical protein
VPSRSAAACAASRWVVLKLGTEKNENVGVPRNGPAYENPP